MLKILKGKPAHIHDSKKEVMHVCEHDKEEKKAMLPQVDKPPMNSVSGKSKNKRTNLLSSATEETLKTVNEMTKKQRGLSNLTYKQLYREE